MWLVFFCMGNMGVICPHNWRVRQVQSLQPSSKVVALLSPTFILVTQGASYVKGLATSLQVALVGLRRNPVLENVFGMREVSYTEAIDNDDTGTVQR